MKKLFAILLCILLLAGCAETYDGPTETKQVLSEYEVRHYYSFFDWEAEQSISRSTYAYDIYGNRVRELSYDNGELVQETRMKYDEQGREISRTDIDREGWFPIIEGHNKRTYDEQGRVLSYSYHNGWGVEQSRSTYTYDDEANTMTWSNGEGDSIIYYYDENGLHLRSVSDDGYETIYQYDDRGNRIGWTATKDGVFWGSYEACFDEQSRLIWGTSYDERGVQSSHTTYTYDDEANTTTITKSDGSVRYEYRDGDGRLYLIEDYTSEGELSMVQQYFYRDIRVPANGEE